MSLRALSRAVPKSSFRQFSSRSLSTAQRPSLFQTSLRAAVAKPTTYRAFTTSPFRYEPAGQGQPSDTILGALRNVDELFAVDTELSAKLEQELSLEKESKDPEQLPEALQDFVENSGFEVRCSRLGAGRDIGLQTVLRFKIHLATKRSF